eukprot:m.207994 g.207994  ORF g.207994 m.207994 type:complete len:59 (+) comp15038_c1_seq1:225-401(+)
MCVNEQDVPLSCTQTHTPLCETFFSLLNHSTSQLLTRLTYCCCSLYSLSLSFSHTHTT